MCLKKNNLEGKMHKPKENRSVDEKSVDMIRARKSNEKSKTKK